MEREIVSKRETVIGEKERVEEEESGGGGKVMWLLSATTLLVVLPSKPTLLVLYLLLMFRYNTTLVILRAHELPRHTLLLARALECTSLLYIVITGVAQICLATRNISRVGLLGPTDRKSVV